MIIGDKQMRTIEMMVAVGLKHRPTFVANYLNPAIEAAVVTMFYPDNPRHPGQRYLLTVKGLMYYNEQKKPE